MEEQDGPEKYALRRSSSSMRAKKTIDDSSLDDEEKVDDGNMAGVADDDKVCFLLLWLSGNSRIWTVVVVNRTMNPTSMTFFARKSWQKQDRAKRRLQRNLILLRYRLTLLTLATSLIMSIGSALAFVWYAVSL